MVLQVPSPPTRPPSLPGYQGNAFTLLIWRLYSFFSYAWWTAPLRGAMYLVNKIVSRRRVDMSSFLAGFALLPRLLLVTDRSTQKPFPGAPSPFLG